MIKYHTSVGWTDPMATLKIAITLDKEILDQIHRWIKEGKYPNRSRAIQEIIKERIAYWRKNRLIEETSKLDAREESALADEGLAAEDETWPRY